jgi:hypothetical protein
LFAVLLRFKRLLVESSQEASSMTKGAVDYLVGAGRQLRIAVTKSMGRKALRISAYLHGTSRLPAERTVTRRYASTIVWWNPADSWNCGRLACMT